MRGTWRSSVRPAAPIYSHVATQGVPTNEGIYQRQFNMSRESTTPPAYNRMSSREPPQLDFNMPLRTATPETSIRLPVVNQMGNQMNQRNMDYGSPGAPTQTTIHQNYPPTPNGLSQKKVIETVEMTTFSPVEPTPVAESEPFEEPEPSCCWPRDSDELHYAYTNLSDSTAGRMMRVILLLVPISMILVGHFYKEDCKIRRMIPYWLIVTGVLWIVHTTMYFLFQNNPGKNTVGCRFTEAVCFYIATVWVILGFIWTFGILDRVVLFVKDESITTTELPEAWNTTIQLPPASNGTTQDHKIDNPLYCHPIPFFCAVAIISLVILVIAVILFFAVFTFEYSYSIKPPVKPN